MKRKWWLISVSGYGEFAHYGTDDEAEEMRAHKAQWEGGVGRKKPIPATHPKAKEAQEHTKWERDNDYPLDERDLASIGQGCRRCGAPEVDKAGGCRNPDCPAMWGEE